jgi:hypothetical protein
LVKYKIQPSDDLADKYVQMLIKKEKKESLKNEENENKLLKKAAQINL